MPSKQVGIYRRKMLNHVSKMAELFESSPDHFMGVMINYFKTHGYEQMQRLHSHLYFKSKADLKKNNQPHQATTLDYINPTNSAIADYNKIVALQKDEYKKRVDAFIKNDTDGTKFDAANFNTAGVPPSQLQKAWDEFNYKRMLYSMSVRMIKIVKRSRCQKIVKRSDIPIGMNRANFPAYVAVNYYISLIDELAHDYEGVLTIINYFVKCVCRLYLEDPIGVVGNILSATDYNISCKSKKNIKKPASIIINNVMSKQKSKINRVQMLFDAQKRESEQRRMSRIKKKDAYHAQFPNAYISTEDGKHTTQYQILRKKEASRRAKELEVRQRPFAFASALTNASVGKMLNKVTLKRVLNADGTFDNRKSVTPAVLRQLLNLSAKTGDKIVFQKLKTVTQHFKNRNNIPGPHKAIISTSILQVLSNGKKRIQTGSQ
jgi:hypothetical protein